MEIDNTAAQHAAIVYKLMDSAKLYGCDPEDHLASVSTRIAD